MFTIRTCQVVSALVAQNVIGKNAAVVQHRELSSGRELLVTILQTRVCVNEWLGFYEPRIHSTTLVVIEDDKVYFLVDYGFKSQNLGLIFRYFDGLMCDEQEARIVVKRKDSKGNLLFNDSNDFFAQAFGKVYSTDEKGKIVCKRVKLESIEKSVRSAS